MPSTFSSVRMMRSRWVGRVGATEKPQLPITTVVTPCHGEQLDQLVPDDLGVVVGVDVDEAGADDLAGGVDRAGRVLGGVAEGHDLAVLDGDITDEAGPPRPVDDRATGDLEVVGHR